MGVLHSEGSVLAGLTENVTEQINVGADAAGFDRGVTADPRQIIAQVIGVALGFVASFLIILILLSGFWFITARGDESKVEKAKKTLRSAIIGFIIVSLGYSITVAVSTYARRAQTRTFQS